MRNAYLRLPMLTLAHCAQHLRNFCINKTTWLPNQQRRSIVDNSFASGERLTEVIS